MSLPTVNSRYYSKAQRIAGAIIWNDLDIIQVPFFLNGQLTNTTFAAFQVPGRDMYLQGYMLTLQQGNTTSSVSFSVNLLNGAGQSMAGTQYPDPTLLVFTGVQASAQINFSPYVALPSGSFWQANVVVPAASAGLTGSGLTLTYYFSYASSPLINPQAVYSLQGQGIGFWTIGQNFSISTP